MSALTLWWTSRRGLMLASGLLAAGGVSWLVKIGVIVATDGRVITTGPAAVLMSAGLILLALGAAAGGAWLARRAHPVLGALAALVAVGAVAVSSAAVGSLGAALARGRGPAYWDAEGGLLAAALLWSALGAATLARARRAGAAERGIA